MANENQNQGAAAMVQIKRSGFYNVPADVRERANAEVTFFASKVSACHASLRPATYCKPGSSDDRDCGSYTLTLTGDYGDQFALLTILGKR